MMVKRLGLSGRYTAEAEEWLLKTERLLEERDAPMLRQVIVEKALKLYYLEKKGERK